MFFSSVTRKTCVEYVAENGRTISSSELRHALKRGYRVVVHAQSLCACGAKCAEV